MNRITAANKAKFSVNFECKKLKNIVSCH